MLYVTRIRKGVCAYNTCWVIFPPFARWLFLIKAGIVIILLRIHLVYFVLLRPSFYVVYTHLESKFFFFQFELKKIKLTNFILYIYLLILVSYNTRYSKFAVIDIEIKINIYILFIYFYDIIIYIYIG